MHVHKCPVSKCRFVTPARLFSKVSGLYASYLRLTMWASHDLPMLPATLCTRTCSQNTNRWQDAICRWLLASDLGGQADEFSFGAININVFMKTVFCNLHYQHCWHHAFNTHWRVCACRRWSDQAACIRRPKESAKNCRAQCSASTPLQKGCLDFKNPY